MENPIDKVFLYGTPSPKKNESPDSWLIRSAIHHNFSVNDFLRFIKIDLERDELNGSILQHIDSYTAARVYQLQLNEIDSIKHRANTIELSKSSNTRLFLKEGNFKICPACLKSDGSPYIRWSWQLSQSVECDEHSDHLLQEQCPSCHLKLSWMGAFRPSFARNFWHSDSITRCAHCGFDLLFTRKQSSKQKLQNICAAHSRFLYAAVEMSAGSELNVTDRILDFTVLLLLFQDIEGGATAKKEEAEVFENSKTGASIKRRQRHRNYLARKCSKVPLSEAAWQPYCPSIYPILHILYRPATGYAWFTEEMTHLNYSLEDYEVRLTSSLGIKRLPCGIAPRKLLFWLTSQLIVNQDPIVPMINVCTLAVLLFVKPTGGVNGSVSRLKEQLTRLLACEWEITYCTGVVKKTIHFRIGSGEIKDFTKEAWPGAPHLSDKAFKILTGNANKIPKDVVSAFSTSPTKLDASCWISIITQDEIIKRHLSWNQVFEIFPFKRGDEKHMKYNAKQSLKSSLKYYPNVKVVMNKHGVTIRNI